MDIEEKTEGEVTTLFLKDKMVGDENAAELRDKVEELVEMGRVHIVLDLAEVPYIDSAGLGEIIYCYTMVNRENGKVKITNINERLRSLLSRTRLAWVSEESSEDTTVRAH